MKRFFVIPKYEKCILAPLVLKEDISEENNLSSKKTGIALKLLGKLKKCIEEVNAPVPAVLN